MEELTLEKFEEASEVVQKVTQETKLVYSEYFSAQTGNRVYFKPENMQVTGAYKVRGAYYKISTLSTEEKERGLIAASAGNHAQGVAYAAKLAGIKAVIVMPTTTPLIKINRTKNYGAEVVLCGNDFDEACAHAYELAAEKGYTFVHPFDDTDVAAGQGSIAMENTEIHCYDNAVHGAEDLQTSFAKSCNTSYANIGLGLNKAKFASLCKEMMFDTNLPVAYPFKQSSFVLNKDSNTDQVTQMAIGQGETLVTPMHMALITSAIANKGTLMRPYIIDHTENYRGVTVKNFRPSVYGSLISESEALKLQEFMSLVVSEGTGSKLSGQGYHAAGKTGSAEFSNVKGESHAWFTGYASTEEKGSIVVTVIVENGGAGSTTAVPIAKQMFDTYFSQP